MTGAPATDAPGIVAFIEAQFKRREWIANEALENLNDGEGIAKRLIMRELLAVVTKDRAVLALHASVDIDGRIYCTDDSDPYPCQTVRLLAAIDADHPGYDPDWKPVAS